MDSIQVVKENKRHGKSGTQPAAVPVDRTSLDLKWFIEQLSSCSPQDATGADKFKWEYLLDSLLSKYGGTDVEGALPLAERVEACKAKFLAYNDTCGVMNRFGLQISPFVLHRAKRIIADVLKEYDHNVFRYARFTSGAASDFRRDEGDPFFKYNAKKELHVTSSAYKYARAIIACHPRWHEGREKRFGNTLGLKLVPGGTFGTVPKNAKIERPIVPQPSMNQYLQRAVGLYIRDQLRAVGINLKNQGRNQKLARIGSIYGNLATIDLSGASDLISDRVVWELLPPKWYEVLDDLRPKLVKINGEWQYLHQFSSMGNGYTFELETLLFYALVKAACEEANADGIVSIYGDDIICPTEGVVNVITVLSQCGFTVNSEKSFWKGPFRESCGKHYYSGVDVTPFYIRKPVDSIPRYIWLLNRMRAWSATTSGVCDPALQGLWLQLRRKYVPRDFLGGWDVNSCDAVASPDSPRYRLVVQAKRVRMKHYYPMLFRYWQPKAATDGVKAIQTAYGIVYQTISEKAYSLDDLPLWVEDPIRPDILLKVLNTYDKKVLETKDPNVSQYRAAVPLFPSEIR